MRPFRHGYEASAEQFMPRDPVEFGVLAEACGMDSAFVSDHFQRAATSLDTRLHTLDDCGGRANRADPAWDVGVDADLPIRPGGPREGVRHDGLPLS